ncbi:MAG: hypothetical protein JWR42_2950, partial [Marmoricola sp.]|nr:hypothetical protein [Marmoricola sp.]
MTTAFHKRVAVTLLLAAPLATQASMGAAHAAPAAAPSARGPL